MLCPTSKKRLHSFSRDNFDGQCELSGIFLPQCQAGSSVINKESHY